MDAGIVCREGVVARESSRGIAAAESYRACVACGEITKVVLGRDRDIERHSHGASIAGWHDQQPNGSRRTDFHVGGSRDALGIRRGNGLVASGFQRQTLRERVSPLIAARKSVVSGQQSLVVAAGEM